MELRCTSLVKTIIEINYFWMFMLHIKVYNIETCKHHGTKFINFLFVKLIILCKPLFDVSHFQKWYQNDVI